MRDPGFGDRLDLSAIRAPAPRQAIRADAAGHAGMRARGSPVAAKRPASGSRDVEGAPFQDPSDYRPTL
jgi:hypothetical protein